MRSHQPDSAKPFPCMVDGCTKRFWTKQHLQRHEDVHKGEKSFKVSTFICIYTSVLPHLFINIIFSAKKTGVTKHSRNITNFVVISPQSTVPKGPNPSFASILAASNRFPPLRNSKTTPGCTKVRRAQNKYVTQWTNLYLILVFHRGSLRMLASGMFVHGYRLLS